jgi:hypothetical protein
VKDGAQKVVYADYAPTSATAVYTVPGNGPQRSRLRQAYFCNVDTVARNIEVRIVPVGGTITDVKYNIVDALLGGLLEAGETLYAESDGEAASDFLHAGDMIVLLAGTASTIATRLCVEEIT